MNNLKERIDTINLSIKVLEKSKISLFNKEYSDYQKEIVLALRGLEMLHDDYAKNIMEVPKVAKE